MNWWAGLHNSVLNSAMGWFEEFKMKSYKQPVFDKNLHPEVYAKLVKILDDCYLKGLNVKLFNGYRSYNHQAVLYSKGRTIKGKIVTHAQPGYSYHNFGLAIDLVFIDRHGNWSWSEKHDWNALGEIYKKHGLDWGGNFKKLVDRPHAQAKINISLKKCRELYDIDGLEEVWKNIKIK